MTSIPSMAERLPFRRDTSATPTEWSEANPSRGHCAVAALIVNDQHGGAIMRCITPSGESHYFNRLPDGSLIDVTAGQFNELPAYRLASERTREYLLSNDDTRRRYELLRERMAAQ